MKPAKFDYEKPRHLDDAAKLLAGANGEGKIIAGGQSLGPILNLRLAQPALLIDVRGLTELSGVKEERDAIVYGATTTHAAIEDGRVPDAANGLLRKVARGIAYRAVRNRGTLGGSLAHADPAADWLNVMVLLDADIELFSARGKRSVRATALVDGPLSTVIGADEIVTSIRVPKLSPKARWSYYKFNRKPGEFAEAIAALVVDEVRGLARGIVGATAAAPSPIADARPFIGAFDPTKAAHAVTAAGFLAGSYEYQVHLVALKRAVMQLSS
ncbi:MAG: carbon monoxide dehydrogenase [Betaproteobacteria bacterium]|nr:carbon monoxide dehydrogenase [Betaproteobacteria bacterium]